MKIGMRLKGIRRSKGLSQRQLALQAGVTNGLISMIEQDRSSPSIASLKRILDAIPISLSEFFDTEDETSAGPFYREDELLEINPGKLLRVSPNVHGLSLRQVGDAARRNLQMLHERYDPGADTGAELYSHLGEEAGIVISGEIELTVGAETRTLRRNEAYMFDSQIPHRFRNAGGEVCEIVSACTPPTF